MQNWQLWLCPSRGKPEAGGYNSEQNVLGWGAHYGMSCAFVINTWCMRRNPPVNPTGWQGFMPLANLAQIPDPAEVAVFGESSYYGPTEPGYGVFGCWRMNYHYWVHNGGENVALADGHAKWYSGPGKAYRYPMKSPPYWYCGHMPGSADCLGW